MDIKTKLAGATALLVLASGVVPVFAQNATSTNSLSLNVSCVTAAIQKRDSAISSAVDAFSSAVKTALTGRTTALVNGWNITVAKNRRAAIKAAWTNYRNSSRDARKTLKAAIMASWQTFYGDRKICGPKAATEDSTVHGVDGQIW